MAEGNTHFNGEFYLYHKDPVRYSPVSKFEGVTRLLLENLWLKLILFCPSKINCWLYQDSSSLEIVALK